MRMPVTLLAAALLAACAAPREREPASARMSTPDFLASEIRTTRHDAADDLVSAGLGLEGLRAIAAPAPADAEAPTPAELRRRAFHANWRGIAHLSDPAFAPLPVVAGREYSAFARLAGARTTHRVLAQVPDGFDTAKRCLVVAPASGSRGIYGAVALAAPWALPKRCAVVYTDKGAGTGFYDHDSDCGVALDGSRAARGTAPLEFEAPREAAVRHAVSIKHAHSGDNPEADWGRHVLQAARFGLHALDLAHPEAAPFTPANTRVIAAALSNGAGAVLRATEIDEDGLIDAVVAAAPNVTAPGARPLYDLATEAALLQPCALLAMEPVPQLLPDAAWRAAAHARCASLAAAGLVDGADAAAHARDALARLRAAGWTDGPLALAGFHLGVDLWRAIVATYASAYALADAAAPACGYGFAAFDAAFAPRATTPAERALWWSDASGIAPTAGVGIVDTKAVLPDATYPGLACARALWTGDDEAARTVRASVEAARASARPRARYVHVVHGADDSLIPVAHTSRPWVEAARANGANVVFDEVPRAQHFDAFLAFPQLSGRYVPLLPHAHAAMDRAWAAIEKP